MQISKREFLKKLGLLGAAGVSGAALGDDYVATSKTLPPGSVGDPDNVWFGHVRKMQETPGWEEVFIANTCSQIGPRATRIFECDYITDRAEIRRPGYAPKDVVGWFGVDGAHEAFPVAYRQLLPVGCENVLCAGRMLGAPDTIDTFRLICPCFVTGQAAGTAAALCAKGDVPPRSLPYSELRTALGNARVFLG